MPCHNCRRSRLRCDRSIPTCNKCHSIGQECLGYGKLLLWTNSVASRGKMMGKTYGVTRALEAVRVVPQEYCLALSYKAALSLDSVSNLCWQQGDPTFQHLSTNTKFYLSYFDEQVCKDLVLHDLPGQNPFRDLLPLSADHPVLQQIIVANSALRLANVTRKDFFKREQGSYTEAYRDALVAKHRALRLLSEALTSSSSIDSNVVLASIMLFIQFELLDSGRNGWRFHTDGARQLMVYLRQNGKSELSALNGLRNCLISNCAIYDILGTTLTASSSEDGLKVDLLDKEEQANNCLSCPPLLLQIIQEVSQTSKLITTNPQPEKQTQILLSIVDAFDPYTWTSSLKNVSSSFDHKMRSHIGYAYKAAVKIYILRASSGSSSIEPLEELVSEVVLHLTSIPPNDPFFKATCWPSFIAGAETNNRDHRHWVSNRFATALQTLPWGYLSSAIDLLQLIWKHKSQEDASVDWLSHLKLSENNWLIA